MPVAFLFLLVLLASERAEAGAWLPDPGHFYLELRALYATATDGFDTQGGRHTLARDVQPVRLHDGAMQLYTEIGVATRLAVVANFQLLRGLRLGNARALGLGDLDAGLRVLVLDEEVTCSVQASLGVPTGRSDAALPLGTGDLRGTFVLSIGRVGPRVPVFFSVDLGGVVRGSGEQRTADGSKVTVDYASELVFAGELGYVATLERRHRVRVSPRLRLDGRYGTRAPTTPLANQLVDAPIAPESVRFVRIAAGLGVEVQLSSVALLVDATGGAFVWGQGLPAAAQATLALGIKR